MKLYLGSRDYKPDGFLTVDIDPTFEPDVIADVTDLHMIKTGSVEEICASHILEHLPWPMAFKALSEWVRVLNLGGVLRVAIPDLKALAAMIVSGKNVWHATGLIYGTARLENKYEAHQYGYTAEMVITMLSTLGMDGFDWWEHAMPDASNGWMHDEDDTKMAISLNVRAVKRREPIVSADQLFDDLMSNRMRPFDAILVDRMSATPVINQGVSDSSLLLQRVHMRLIEANQRVRYLEKQIEKIGKK